MLVLALALQAVSIAAIAPPPVIRTLPARKPAAKRKKARTVAARPLRFRLLDNGCTQACTGDANARYRVASYASVEDQKMRAISGPILPCETSGAPKCPARGRTVLRAPILND